VILFELTVLLVLVLVNGFLAGSEIAIVALRKTRVDELVALPPAHVDVLEVALPRRRARDPIREGVVELAR
jgi:CBS domain containing-hemolysin-like protein